jgi:signal transduction histidine kinase
MAFIISGCSKQENSQNIIIGSKLHVADSLYFAGNQDSANIVLKNVRRSISASNPLISEYYCLLADWLTQNASKKNLYADSALAFFSNQDLIRKHPDIYYRALLIKGDAALISGKYFAALNYYYQAKRVLSYTKCDNGEFANRMGEIYFQQNNYGLAGKYWAKSYRQLGMCGTNITAQKMFFLKQSSLDNAGYAYQKAGMLDSADYYYQKDLACIEETQKNSSVQIKYLNKARAVLYDNLGGLNLLMGNLPQAKEYLNKCVALNINNNIDGELIPPYIKLAQLYIKTGENAKADSAFEKSRILLNRFGKDNTESLLKWNKLYAAYLLSKKDATGACYCQGNYIRIKDSLDKNLEELYRLDIVRELNNMEQRQILTQFNQNNFLRKIAYLGSIIIVVLLAIILVLVNRNLKKTKRNHRIATQQNEHLQQTLSELERVNKNYIRIMRVMAHDLRNPLSGMTGLAAMLYEEDEFTGESKHMLKLIETTGLHSMEMISELLKTGLADENEKIALQTLDITSLLYDSIELLQFKANDKHQQIIFEGANTPILVEINHEKIWRVINNLIVNAIKFTHTNGLIKVGITQNNKYVLISVADNGIGIPPDQKEAVFEMFTSAKKTGTDGEQPFGLGLSISKRIVEMHNGHIWFEDNVGGGTIFFIELPLTHQ